MPKYISPIDPHVHLRGEEYKDQNPSFAELAFRDAEAVGLVAIIEQPNMTPPIIDKETMENRIRHIDAIRGDVLHYNHIALTSNPEQQRQAIRLIQSYVQAVSGKTFYVRSTNSGQIEITNPADQKIFWQNMVQIGYKGPAIGHLEDAEAFNPEIKFDPAKPETHSLHQCPESELIQFDRQFKFAYDSGFKGTFVALHVSNPETILLGEKLVHQHKPKFRVAYETSWHHMLLNAEEDYPVHGNCVKMNPPLRPKFMQEKLLDIVLQGRTDIIGTDHAPHPYARKLSLAPPSGIPALPFWPRGIELLRKNKIPEKKLQELIFDFANELYNLSLAPKEVEREYNPSLWQAYGWNPFSRIDRTN